jgi:DNA-binding CsgD family transcriptional regulator
VPLLRGAIERLLEGEPTTEELRWMMLGCLAAGEIWDNKPFMAVVTKWVHGAREYGLFTVLAVALSYKAWCESESGLLAAAGMSWAEEMEISAAIQNPGVVGSPGAGVLLWQVWSGQETEARATAARMTADSRERSQGAGLTHALSATGLLEIGLGNYKSAVANLLPVYEEDLTYLGRWSLPDLVEAASGAGDTDRAQLAYERLSDRAIASGTDWALGLLARSRALIARDRDTEVNFQQAIDWLQAAEIKTDLGRAYLLFGEWLRSERRSHDARTLLQKAWHIFESMGAEIFAERARLQLSASAARATPRQQRDTLDSLTPQEGQVAELAAEGLTNREIAARLLISASTVDYHLRKVFQKLGVRSRVELVEYTAARRAT